LCAFASASVPSTTIALLASVVAEAIVWTAMEIAIAVDGLNSSYSPREENTGYLPRQGPPTGEQSQLQD
jgi:hypothetical protein